jgi:Raf kinase inhibitor-like YbhB/YbcL family protein
MRKIWMVMMSMVLLSACGGGTPTATVTPETVGENSVNETPTTMMEEETATMTSEPTSTEAVAETPTAAAEEGEETMDFTLSSAAFDHEEAIPTAYSCDGEDISPPLRWSDPPAGTESFALIADDPDAPVGTWVHWVLYNIPADARELPEDVPAQDKLDDGSLHGKNSWKRRDYGGPCPPSGTHRYFFKLYALDTTLDLESGATKKQLLKAMDGHILAQAELMGTFSR